MPACLWNVRLEKPSLIYNFAFKATIVNPSKFTHITLLKGKQALLAFVDVHDVPRPVPQQLQKLLLCPLRNLKQLHKLTFLPQPIVTQLCKLPPNQTELKSLCLFLQYLLHKLVITAMKDMLTIPVTLFLLRKLEQFPVCLLSCTPHQTTLLILGPILWNIFPAKLFLN